MKKYVIVGAGSRCSYMFVTALYEGVNKDDIVISGVYDTNVKRSEYLADKIKKITDREARVYTDFDTMLNAEKPDGVIVTSTDSTHHEYIVKSLEKGCDVVCEKPMTNTYERCLQIREAEKKSGKNVTVTFNCRFMPYFAKIKELIKSGIVGKPLAVNYEYRLNRAHGGSYFKRWHRFMEISQGMYLHKSTHHLDIANWLIDDEPITVSAIANRVYFGDPSKSFAERCSVCPKASECQSYEPLDDEESQALYFDEAEKVDGYRRDRCCFLPDTDIYDNMMLGVQYKNGAILTYTLNLFSANEGFKITVTGEKGTLEASEIYVGEGSRPDYLIKVLYPDGKFEDIVFEKASGSHAGGDVKLIKMIFGSEKIDDPLGQHAGSFDGVKSAMIGIGANISVKEGKTVDLRPYLDSLR